MTEPTALLGLSVYVILGEGNAVPNVEPWETIPGEDVDPDAYSDAILAGLHVEPSEVSWRLTGGDDHGDGLTSFDYVAEVDTATVGRFLDWVGGTPGEGIPNLGIITGPESFGTIPGGMTWNCSGMDWNVGGITRYVTVDCSVWPITVDAYRATFGEKGEEG
jgi:hypothetical protein